MTSCSVICPLRPVAPGSGGPGRLLIRWQQKAIAAQTGCKFAVFGSCFPDCVFSSLVSSYPGIWLNASFWWHLLLIWWVNIGLRFGNGNEHSPRRIYQQEVEPHFYEPLIIEPLSYMIFHVLGRFDSSPHARTPKKNKSGQPRKTT